MFVVNTICDADWPDIIRVQAEAYHSLAPESKEVLRSKWLVSPESCFIARDNNQTAVAYLLTHPWADTTPPKLHAVIEPTINTNQMFIHDLAVLPHATGKGIASLMLQSLFAALPHMLRFQLVAVQGSAKFWASKGFVAVHPGKLCSSYGDDAQQMFYHR